MRNHLQITHLDNPPCFSRDKEPKFDFIAEAIVLSTCDELGQNKMHFTHEARRYLNEHYKLHVKGSETLTMSRSLLNAGTILKDEACFWLSCIHRRLIARQQI